ncbi:unnamed protein product [Brassica oleracea var. botrytis]
MFHLRGSERIKGQICCLWGLVSRPINASEFSLMSSEEPTEESKKRVLGKLPNIDEMKMGLDN